MLKKNGDLRLIEDFATSRELFREQFYFRVLNPAIRHLHPSTRTRKNNLALSVHGSKTLPKYYRIYPEDVVTLSRNIKLACRSLPSDFPYIYYFMFYKFGQQSVVSGQVSLSRAGLRPVVRSINRIDCASVHYAVNFSHGDEDNFEVFWNADATSRLMPGQTVHKYPLMGLSELGNVTSKFPRFSNLAWRDSARENIRITYMQVWKIWMVD